jgi:hypothetical protein
LKNFQRLPLASDRAKMTLGIQQEHHMIHGGISWARDHKANSKGNCNAKCADCKTADELIEHVAGIDRYEKDRKNRHEINAIQPVSKPEPTTAGKGNDPKVPVVNETPPQSKARKVLNKE